METMTDEQIQQWAKQAGLGDFTLHGRLETKDEALKAFAKLVHDAALVKGEPENRREFEVAMSQWGHWKQYALELQKRLVKYEGGAPMILNSALPAQTPPPLLTVDDVLKIALDCNIRVRTGSGAVKFARAIEAAVRKQFGVTE